MAAFVRVSGPANGNFLIGYPGISATMVSAYIDHLYPPAVLVALVSLVSRAGNISPGLGERWIIIRPTDIAKQPAPNRR
jgi:hypothetical protein